MRQSPQLMMLGNACDAIDADDTDPDVIPNQYGKCALWTWSHISMFKRPHLMLILIWIHPFHWFVYVQVWFHFENVYAFISALDVED